MLSNILQRQTLLFCTELTSQPVAPPESNHVKLRVYNVSVLARPVPYITALRTAFLGCLMRKKSSTSRYHSISYFLFSKTLLYVCVRVCVWVCLCECVFVIMLPPAVNHCVTSRKIAGSIPDVVIRIFQLYYPTGRTMPLGSTQPLTEMSTRNISWGIKAAGA